MSSLLIFNPEHDLALAVGNGPYTPPRSVVDLKRKSALLPALFADNGDFILVTSDVEPRNLETLDYFPEALNKSLTIIYPSQLPSYINRITKIIPWGWDHAIVSLLRENGIPSSLLPDVKKLENIRNLSHRRLTIPFRETVCSLLGKEVKHPVKEIFDTEGVRNFLLEHPQAFFKAPWSSSGRGIVASDHITQKGLMEWAHGVIKKQGSLIAEPSWNKTFDFASEWWIENSEPRFLGYSVFKTSSRGKYHGNFNLSQDQLFSLIKQNVPDFDYRLIEAQKEALKTLVAPLYEGPLGIDMLADSEGEINECVEINLRLTMGHLALKLESWKVGKIGEEASLPPLPTRASL